MRSARLGRPMGIFDQEPVYVESVAVYLYGSDLLIRIDLQIQAVPWLEIKIDGLPVIQLGIGRFMVQQSVLESPCGIQVDHLSVRG